MTLMDRQKVPEASILPTLFLEVMPCFSLSCKWYRILDIWVIAQNTPQSTPQSQQLTLNLHLNLSSLNSHILAMMS